MIHQSSFAVIAAAAALVATGAAAQVPEPIAAPGESVIVTLHAEGAQVYDCKAGADGKLAWAFREPIATLLLDGKTVGRHYAGPNWDHADGSGVTGKVLANAPGKSANDIAWLKLEVTARRGSGVLSLRDGKWLIDQYVLSITVPNQRFRAVRDLLAAP